ncbi:dhkK [Symbiodinium microadriaticum]|nr:dhkK [Symbiodinium microadriaticum]
MTMMINRSIDYTKVSSGFELVPSLESVDLVDSIKWVLNCVGKGRVRETCVSLVADALPADVHRWLITDRQWLLENLLCLTSNAVKFVTKGSIHVRVQLDNSLPFTLSKSIQDILEEHEHVQLSNSSLDNSSSLPSVGKPSDADVSNHESDIEMGFAPQDSGILRDVDLNDAPEFLRFEIEDTGIGISDELRLKLFKPFQQTQRMAGGTGLGLFALSERTKALGGHCGVSDRKDGQSGCCFWFTIPYRPDYTLSCKAMSRSQGSSYESSSLQCSSGNGSGIEHVDLRPSRILIVDDSILIQKTTSRSLTKEGFSVDIAVNGEECVRMTAEKEYDLVLLDLQMPVMNGLEAIARIRARETERITARMTRELASSHDRGIDSYDDGDRDGTLVVAMKLKAFHERLFVIGVSANSDSMSKQEALAAGMDSFIPKPLTIEALRECCWKFRVELYPIRAPSSFEAPLLQGEIN